MYFVDCHDEVSSEEDVLHNDVEKKKFYGGRVSLLFNGGVAASVSLFVAAFGVIGHEFFVLIGLCLFTLFFSCS